MIPRVCVLIPVYNGLAGLLRTCGSLAAAHGDFDVLVVDDGSNPPVELKDGATGRHRLSISRLESNGGITKALNHGLRIAYERGYEFIGRLDASDTVSPDRFVQQFSVLEADPDCGIVGSSIDFVDMKGERLFVFRAPLEDRAIKQRMHVENCIIHSGVMMRTSVVRQTGGYRERCRASEDYDLFRRMLRISKAQVLPQVLTQCEYNLLGLSIARRGRQQRERLNLQMEFFEPGNWISYYGIARTCLAICTPHNLVLAAKRWAETFGGARLEDPAVG